MGYVTIMPCLDMKEGRVVKGVHFVDLRDAGDPVENAVYYEREGADELAMLDIAATLENRATRLDWVQRVAAAITIPLTVGGGIGDLRDMELLFASGVSKVSVNSAAVKRPELISEAAREFGSPRVTIAIDARRNPALPSGFELVVAGGTKPTGKMPLPGQRSANPWGGDDSSHEHGWGRIAGGLRHPLSPRHHLRGLDPRCRLRRRGDIGTFLRGC